MTNGNRVAIVSGGASGIGAATAGLLSERGWRTAIFDLDGADLEAARERAALSDGAMALGVDVTDEAAVARAVDEVQDALGPVTGLMNSAGVAGLKAFFDTDAAHFRRVLDVNVVG